MMHILINFAIYYMFAALVVLGRVTGKKFKWYDRLLGFLFGFIILPILLGYIIRKVID